MATGFTIGDPKVNERIGRKKLKIFQVTHDGTATDVTAASIGFNYISWALPISGTALSSQADLPVLSTAYGTTITMNNLSSGTLTDLLLIGY